MGRKEKAGPAAQLLKLLFRKNILVVLGEKLVDPQVEGFLLDQKFMLGPDENSGNDEASFLAMDAGLVGFPIDSSRVVTKAEMGGIGTSACDQVIQYFLLHF